MYIDGFKYISLNNIPINSRYVCNQNVQNVHVLYMFPTGNVKRISDDIHISISPLNMFAVIYNNDCM